MQKLYFIMQLVVLLFNTTHQEQLFSLHPLHKFLNRINIPAFSFLYKKAQTTVSKQAPKPPASGRQAITYTKRDLSLHTTPNQPRLLDPFNLHNDSKTLQITQEQQARKEALQIAADNMRKYLNNNNPGVKSWLIQTISDICSSDKKALEPTGFQFENTIHAAEWNSKILKSYHYEYAKAVRDQPFSMLTPGSEFRDINHLKKIWQYRQNWPLIRDTITNGVTYPMTTSPTEKIRMQDLQARVTRGNYQSALKPENAKALAPRN